MVNALSLVQVNISDSILKYLPFFSQKKRALPFTWIIWNDSSESKPIFLYHLWKASYLIYFFKVYDVLFLAHLSMKCSWWVIVIAWCSLSSCIWTSTSSHKHLLLWNCWANFTETSQKASSQHPLLNSFRTFGSIKNSSWYGIGKKNTLKIYPLESAEGISV